MRRSFMVWVVAAVVGWVVAFIGVYYSIRTGDTVIADFFGNHSSMNAPQQAAETTSSPDLRIPQEEIEALKKIAPAAGDQSAAGSNGRTTGD